MAAHPNYKKHIRQGREAFLGGETKDDNPYQGPRYYGIHYREASAAHSFWASGFNTAENETPDVPNDAP